MPDAQAFPNAKVNARNNLPKPKTKPNFVIVNVHRSITEDEVKEKLLNSGMNVTKVSRITQVQQLAHLQNYYVLLRNQTIKSTQHKNMASK